MKKQKQLLRQLQKDAIISLQNAGFTNADIARVLHISERLIYNMQKEENPEEPIQLTEIEEQKIKKPSPRKRVKKPDCCTSWEWGWGRSISDNHLKKAVKNGHISSRCAEYIIKTR